MKVLIVGLGSIARKHIDALRQLIPDAEIVALRSGGSNNVVQGVRNIYSVDEIDDSFDFGIISNPTSCHGDTIRLLRHTNFPLFIEKPVFDKIGYEDILKDVAASGRLTYVACNLRFLDCLTFVHNYIKEHPGRRINEVNVYCGSYLPEWRPGTDYRKCYSAIPELGGGVNIDLIHELDYVYWIFGQPIASHGVCRSSSSIDVRSIDYANYTLVYPSFCASVILNYYRRDYKRTLEIVFEDGTWLVDLAANAVTDDKGSVIFTGSNSIKDTYLAQMAYFIDLAKQNKKAENDILSAYDILKLCLDYERLD